MSIKICHASIDENGHIAGGAVGDQTGREFCIRSWYNKPWDVYLECTDPVISNAAARNMEAFAANPNIGYDQGQRLTMYESVISNKGDVTKAKGEADCSSAVSAAYIFAGLKISPANTTRSLLSALLATGKFVAYTDSAHVASDSLAKRGGIYLSEGHHVVMAIENGKKHNPYATPTTTVELGDLGTSVFWVQWKLRDAGYNIKLTGNFDAKMDKIVREFQKAKGLEVDGRVGPITRGALIG